MSLKVSICIPTYEMAGLGVSYLNHSISIIANQDYPSIEVVVSDHSSNNDIEELCSTYSNSINLKYIRNHDKVGNSSANINNAVAHASGEIIKVLFQDDYLAMNSSITNQVVGLVNSDKKWNITACAHTNDGVTIIDPYYPHYQSNILYDNTLSSPSVLIVYKDYYEFFDENLLWFMDTDVYHRLGRKYGPPSICETVNVINRRHSNQITRTLINAGVVSRESMYLRQKHGLSQLLNK